MRPIAERPAVVLLVGLFVVLAAALAPAGLHGEAVTAVSWAVWGATLFLALATFRASGWLLSNVARRLAWLLPAVAMLVLPAGLLAAPGRRALVTAALGVRALAAVTAGAALAMRLGAVGLVQGLRDIGVSSHLTEILASTLASLTVVTRQLSGMLRAREARRPSFGAWANLTARPVETVHGFGRLVAALLLRSLERAEAIEQARRARGGER
jgi:energy-coupling factor transporter transmembrane protein EcfT